MFPNHIQVSLSLSSYSLDFCQVDQLDELFRPAPTPTEQESSNEDAEANASEKKEL